MNCSNCGSPLTQDAKSCPICGRAIENTQVATEEQPVQEVNTIVNDEIVELDEEKEEITEFMAPPTLAVEEENLTSGTGDIANDNDATYDPDAVKEETEVQNEQKRREEDKVDIAIPAVTQPTEVVSSDQDTVPEVESHIETVGDNLNEIKGLKNIPKLKIKLGGKNPNSLLIIVGVLFLIIGLLIGKTIFSKNYCSSTPTRTVEKNVKYVADGKNNITTVSDYQFKIPEDYTYDRANKGLFIFSKETNFRIFIKTEKALYKDLTGSKLSITETFKEQNLSIINVKETKYSDVNFLIFEASVNGNNRIICFADANNDTVFYIEIIDIANNFNYDVLDIVADLVKNSEYVPVESSTEKAMLVDYSNLAITSSLLQKSYAN